MLSRSVRSIAVLVLIAGAPASVHAQPTVVIPPGNTSPGNTGSGGDGGEPTATPQPLSVEVVPQPSTPEPAREHDAEALKVLDEAEAAIADLEAFTATLTMTPRSVFKGTNPEGSAQIIARRSPTDSLVWQVRITGSIIPDRVPEALDIDASFDGNRMRYIDRTNRVVGARIIPVRIDLPYYEVPARLWEQELWTRRDPFAEIRGADKVTLEPRQTVDGVECDVVRGVLPGGQITHTVAVGVEDRLPRRMVEGFEFRMTPDGPPMTGDYAFVYTGLVVDPELTDADFVLAVPDGYEDQVFPQANPPTPATTNIVPKPSEGNGEDSASPDADSTAAAAEESGEDSGDESGPDGSPLSSEQIAAMMSQITSSVSGAAVSASAPGRQIAAVEMATEFELKDAAGQDVRLSTLRGKPVVLIFWGSWNPWAREMLSALKPLIQETPDVRYLALAIRERSGETSAQRFAALATGATLVPAGDEVAAKYDIGAIPSIVVVDAMGRIKLRHTGYSAGQSPVEAVRAALGLGATP